MSRETLTIKYLNAPRKDGESWNIKDERGVQYYLNKGLETKLTQGGTFDVQTEAKTSKTGRSYNIITEVYNGASTAPVGTDSGKHTTASTPVSLTNKDEMIFVCGIVNNWVRANGANVAGKDLEDSIVFVTESARRAWQKTFMGKQEDLNDPIPF
jgi:hypothetical protein